MRIACVGAATAKEVEKFNLEVELVPEDSTAEHLAKALVDTDSLDSANVLVVTGNRNREVLVKLLEEVGRAIVDVMPLYETDYADVEKLPTLDYYRTHGADAIVFTSSSTVDSFAEQEDVLTLREGARKPIHCSIGPITSESLKDNGMSVDLESPKSSLESVVETLVETLGTADT